MRRGGDRSLTRATARVSCHGLAKSVNNNTAPKLSQTAPHRLDAGWMDGPGYFFFFFPPPIPFLLSSPPPERQRFPAHAKTFRRIDRAHRNCNQTELAERRVGREKKKLILLLLLYQPELTPDNLSVTVSKQINKMCRRCLLGSLKSTNNQERRKTRNVLCVTRQSPPARLVYVVVVDG